MGQERKPGPSIRIREINCGFIGWTTVHPGK
jgi:hypothetical protein